MAIAPLVQQSTAFLEHLEEWTRSLPVFRLREEIAEPERASMFSADMVVGFCSQGSLASPRVAGLVPAVVELFRLAHDFGVRHFILAQDTHSEDAPEFQSFPVH